MFLNRIRPFFLQNRALPDWLLPILMIMPWFWTAYGLYVIKDYRVAFLLYELLGCLLPVSFFLQPPYVFSWNPLNRYGGITLAAMAMAAVGILGVWTIFNPVLLQWASFLSHIQEVGIEPKAHFWSFSVYFLTLNPIFEELFWRGLVYRHLRQRFGYVAGLLVSSLFFGAWHWVIVQHYFTPAWALFATGMVTAGGVIFGWLYEKTDSLLPPILVHSLGADLPIVIFIYAALVKVHGFG